MDAAIRDGGVFLFAHFRLDPVRRTLLREGVQVNLAPRLFDTLSYIVANHERLVEKNELLAAVWGRRNVEAANLSQTIFALRKMLQTGLADGTIIVTAPGRGYRCGVPVVFEATLGGGIAAGSFGDPACPAKGVVQDRHSWPRHWNMVGVTAVTLVLAVFGSTTWRGVSIVDWRRPAATPLFLPPPHSVAVMAFTNLSGDASQDYISDGLSEELIDSLGRVSALRVPARLSSFFFKGKQIPLGDIARQLNVAAILEGSVRRHGTQLRITVRLINAQDSSQLWSQSYDRDQGDVVKLQEDIAQAVAWSLKVTLKEGDALGSAPRFKEGEWRIDNPP